METVPKLFILIRLDLREWSFGKYHLFVEREWVKAISPWLIRRPVVDFDRAEN